jgi:uncharacterized protein YbaR (Trm112 family)
MDRKLLDLLACPATRQPLQPLQPSALGALNAAIAEGRVRRFDGEPPPAPLAAGLATADGRRIYRVDEGIPVLLAGEAIDAATAAA